MENYDASYFQQLAPLIAFEGLDSVSAAPAVGLVLENLKLGDITGKIWDNSLLKNRLANQKYLITEVSSPNYTDRLTGVKDPEKHSPNSPFNVDSELFPNGILSIQWFKKYLESKPFAFIKVFELGPEAKDDAFVAQLSNFKTKLAQANVKFVAIVLSSLKDTDERILKLRAATGLTRAAGLLSVSTQSPTLEKDVEIMVVNLLSNLKSSSVEFYAGIESKIRQRNKKYYSIPSSSDIDTTVELTPRHLETRNALKAAIISQYAYPHNLEASIKPLESSYQHLVEILHENYFAFAKDRISDHDLKLYEQIRILVDVTAFHIVRAYLSIEEPLTALKKHAAHVLNVSTAVGNKIDLSEWISIQYEWLASLLLLVPQSIIQGAQTGSGKKLKSSKLLGFLGGVRYEKDDIAFDILTESSLIYLKAASYITDRLKNPARQLDFLSKSKTEEQISEKRLRLLIKASETTTGAGTSSQLEVYSSLLGHIHFLTAEEYFKRGKDEDIQRAIEYFDSSFHRLPIEWSYIAEVISNRLMECYQKLKAPIDVLKCAVLLSTIKVHSAQKAISTVKLDLGVVAEASIDVGANMSPLFEVELVFFNENLLQKSVESSDSFVHDKLVTQLFIKPNFSVESLRSCFEHEVDIFLQITELKVEYERIDRKDVPPETCGLPDVIISHTKDEQSRRHQTFGETEKASANLLFEGSDGKAVEIVKEIKKAGTYAIKAISLQSEIVLRHGDKELVILDRQELHKSFLMEQSHSLYQWYRKVVNDNLVKVPLKLNGVKHNVIRVLPIKPDVIVHLKTSDVNNIILGEKVALKFDIHVGNHNKLSYTNMSLSPRVNVVCNDDDKVTQLMDAQISWKGLKDDEALQLVGLSEPTEVELSLSIRSASLHSEEVIMESSKTYRVHIDMKTIVSETLQDVAQEVAVYDTANYVLPINNKPIEFKFGITPKYRESAQDMPCPFILQGDEDSGSLPIVTRLWSGNLGVSEATEFEIRAIDYSIKSKNPEISVETLDGDSMYYQVFTTRSRTGAAHRNVTIVAAVEVEWCRKSSMHLNVYKSPVWEIALPLADPRVLHEVQRISTNDKTCKLVYVIENPTPRTFTFSTKLVDDNDRFIWNLEDERNVFPLTQSRFPVMPFSRFVMEYYANYSAATDETIQLPQFTAFDVQYKVALPTLPVSKDIAVKSNGGLYWKSTGEMS